MKNILPLLFGAALLPLVANAQSYSNVVGYETVNMAAGFNYIGVRLHQPIVVAGNVEAVSTTSITDNDVNLGDALTDTTTYILEIENGSGAIAEVLGSAASGNVLTTTPTDLSGLVAVGDSYAIRPASTLASVFGASNEAGLVAGFFGIAGADVVFVPDGSGNLDQFYYDDGQTSWADVDGNPVDGAAIPLIYTDGVVISANGALNLVVAGEVKTVESLHACLPGFNYLGSVYPAGATLSSAFDGSVASLDQGFFGIAGADVFFIPDGAGGLDQYYYDGGQTSWADVDGNPVDGTTISLPSGVVLSNEGAAFNLLDSEPAFYSSL